MVLHGVVGSVRACMRDGALGGQQHVAHTRAATGQATLQGMAGK